MDPPMPNPERLSHVMRKPIFCIYTLVIMRNKSAVSDSLIPQLPKSKILSSSAAIQPGLCRTWSEHLKTGFLMKQLI